MNVLTIIPARMNSSRFPGKPMALIGNKPMIGHVYERCIQASLSNLTVVATCDLEILDYIESIGGRAIMTSATHERASDRCAEALGYLEKSESCIYDIVIMVQGDEPMTVPAMLDQAVQPMLLDPDIKVTNLLAKISSYDEFISPNSIKVVIDDQHNALYMSRQPIPTTVDVTDDIDAYKQVCIIPFRRDYLLEYTRIKPTPLEIKESIDMLRVMESGSKVKMVPTEFFTHAVDTPDDLEQVRRMMRR